MKLLIVVSCDGGTVGTDSIGTFISLPCRDSVRCKLVFEYHMSESNFHSSIKLSSEKVLFVYNMCW